MDASYLDYSARDVYEVEKIIRKKRHPTRGTLYLVKWFNFPNSENTWEPAENFSRKLLDDFEAKQVKRKRRKISSPASSSSTSSPLPTTTTNANSDTTTTSTNCLPKLRDATHERELTLEPIIVTDVTAKDLTVTISECETQEGFFSAHQAD